MGVEEDSTSIKEDRAGSAGSRCVRVAGDIGVDVVLRVAACVYEVRDAIYILCLLASSYASVCHFLREIRNMALG